MTFSLFSVGVAACGAQPTEADDDASVVVESSLVSDVEIIRARPDGAFDVTCKDGRVEIATSAQIVANDVCKPVPVERDPFDPGSCSGPAITEEEARAFFEPAASRAEIGTFRWLQRTRACNALTGCAEWSKPTFHSRRNYFFVTKAGAIHSYFAASDGKWASQCGSVQRTRACGSGYAATLTNHCFRVTSSTTSRVAGDESYTETSYAALLEF